MSECFSTAGRVSDVHFSKRFGTAFSSSCTRVAVASSYCQRVLLSELLVELQNQNTEQQRTESGNSSKDDIQLAVPYYDEWQAIPDDQRDIIEYALSLLHTQQFSRAMNALTEANGQHAIYLRQYAAFLALLARKSQGMVVDQQISQLRDEIEGNGMMHQHDAFSHYLRALIFLEQSESLREQAEDALVQSLKLFPYNWSAWQLLAGTVIDKKRLIRLSEVLPNTFLRNFWFVHVLTSLEEEVISAITQESSALTLLNELLSDFPNSLHLLGCCGALHYQRREYDAAQHYLEYVHEKDPYRLENMDFLSNIYYVKEERAKLAALAHSVFTHHKFDPCTQLIIGNYYSSKQKHDRAVLYFKRALILSPKYTSAYTLMGHELVEMRQTKQAIAAYRSAVNVNPNDYRAWYGLGQVYEILQQPAYSLHYFQKATNLRPYDPRMWLALGDAYEKINRTSDAEKCYKKAETLGDQEHIATLKLAKLCVRRGEHGLAAEYWRKIVTRHEKQSFDQLFQTASPEVIEALQFLAQHCRDNVQLAEAEMYANHITSSNTASATAKDSAFALLKEIIELRNAMSTQSQPSTQQYQSIQTRAQTSIDILSAVSQAQTSVRDDMSFWNSP